MAAAEAKNVKPDQSSPEKKGADQTRRVGSSLVDVEGNPIRIEDPWPAQIPEGTPVVSSTRKKTK